MKRRHIFKWLRPALAALLAFGLEAAPADAAEKNLPVPRFVTLRTDPVNVRTGPGERYPIDWVYHRKDLPVEIIAEFENWRKIRDADGTTGWVHERMVTGRRSVLVQGAVRGLHEEAKTDAPTVARAEPGVRPDRGWRDPGADTGVMQPSHGNFSPGSTLRCGATSECANTRSARRRWRATISRHSAITAATWASGKSG